MQRVLDLDLDFFVHPVVFGAEPNGLRPDPGTYRVEIDPDTQLESVDVEEADPIDAAVAYARERLRLDESGPGRIVENHGEVFALWRDLIDNGTLRLPFHVTHVDAHGDFSEGQTGYRGVFEVLGLAPSERPARSQGLLTDGDYLAHAVACRWIAELHYVYCPKGGSDIGNWAWENFERPNWSHEHPVGALRLHPLDDTIIGHLGLPDGPAPPSIRRRASAV